MINKKRLAKIIKLTANFLKKRGEKTGKVQEAVVLTEKDPQKAFVEVFSKKEFEKAIK